MKEKALSASSFSIIDSFLHFKIGSAVCPVPYFNNKTERNRAALRVKIGKGSPSELRDEATSIALKNHIDPNLLSDEGLKKLLRDNNLGTDCSGFAYYVLNAETEEQTGKNLGKSLSFASCTGFLQKIRCLLRPAENCDVLTLAHDNNSRSVPLNIIKPGDMIVMKGTAKLSLENIKPPEKNANGNAGDRDHILLVHLVEYENAIPTVIHYSHSIAYPEDGLYGTGVRQGKIVIENLNKNLLEQKWIENSREGFSNPLFLRARKSQIEIRRLNWL